MASEFRKQRREESGQRNPNPNSSKITEYGKRTNTVYRKDKYGKKKAK